VITGIITKAQEANIQSGIAALEEYLQQKYVEYYDEADNYNCKPELLNAKISNLLLKDGTRDYIVNDGKIYYLINKESLPSEIKENLVGGNTTEWAKYIRLQDVYGITNELKVYYCDTETGTVYGDIDVQEQDKNTPIKMINNDSNMKAAITSALADIGITVDSELGVTTRKCI
jgi:hypothetical protein